MTEVKDILIKKSVFSDRIKQIIDYENITANKLSKILRYPRSQTVYDVVNGKIFPSFSFLYRFFSTKMSEKYDPIWLITGKGEMLRKGNYPTENKTELPKVTEPLPKYTADLLQEKENRIKDLQGQIEFLKKMIEEMNK